MTEFGAQLFQDIEKSFAQKLLNDKKLKALGNQVAKTTDYNVANDYAVRAGELLSEAITENTDGMAYMSKEVAEEVLKPLLTADHDLIATATAQVQANMNAANNIGLGIQVPQLDTNRINGIIDKVASYDTLDEAQWMLKEPIINYSQSVVDQAVRDNARTTSKAGLKTYIVREAEAAGTRTVKRGKRSYMYHVPCKWCASLEGRYLYENAPDDIYRRHESCRCKVTFVRGKKRQDVWSKKEWTEEDTEKQIAKIEKAQKKAEKQALAERRSKAEMTLRQDVGFETVDPTLLKKVDLELLENTTDRLKSLEDRFGMIHKSVNTSVMYNGRSSSFAYVTNYSDNPRNQYLTLCGKYYKNIDDMLRETNYCVDIGWSMPIDLANRYEVSTYTVTHEYGHIIHNVLCSEYNLNHAYSYTTRDYTAMVKNELVQIARTNNPEFSLFDNISKYGCKNTNEFFAEVFANSQGSTPNELGIAMQEWLKGKGF